MCGINGFTWPDQELIDKMNQIAHNRGPDDRGTFIDACVSLGLVRLAIIDLSEKGHQPMANQDASLWISFNGEVYNYQPLREELIDKGYTFKSDSDTEVVLHAYTEYGPECFNKFNGMWGMAIYDVDAQQLILSRDRFGIKPLYYYADDSRLIFSSMLSTILAHDIETGPNNQAIMEYLAFNLEQHDEKTFFSNILSLNPGHVLVYDLKEKDFKISSWYMPQPAKHADATELRETFINSVQLRTIADVPVGVCLSGGVDSTAITTILDEHLPGAFNTYSLVAPGSITDESEYIEEVVRLTKADPYYTTVSPDVFLEEVDDFVAAMEEPVTGLSAYAQYRVFKLAKEQGAKVLLDGQGGDELFAGYIYFFGYYFYELFVKFRWGALLHNMYLYRKKLGNFFPHAMFAFLLMPKWLRDLVWAKRIMPWINHDFLRETGSQLEDPRWKRMTIRESLDLTLFSTSIPHNLVWEDKSSMRWSIESRVPFLDFEFVEAALSFDTKDFIQNGETKIVFKQALDRLLPDKIRERTDKVGFAAPEEQFFNDARVIAFAKEIIYSDSFKQRPFWRWDEIENIFTRHLAGETDASRLIWKWLNLELWLREFFSSNKSAAPVEVAEP